MNELDEPFSGVDGTFKIYVDKLLPLNGLFRIKKLNLWNMMFNGNINN